MSCDPIPTRKCAINNMTFALKSVTLATGNRIARMKKRSRIVMVIGAWLLVITILLALGI